jgi:hypothetical protein
MGEWMCSSTILDLGTRRKWLNPWSVIPGSDRKSCACHAQQPLTWHSISCHTLVTFVFSDSCMSWLNISKSIHFLPARWSVGVRFLPERRFLYHQGGSEAHNRKFAEESFLEIKTFWARIWDKLSMSLNTKRSRCRRTWGIVPWILNLGSTWRWLVSFITRSLYHRGKDPWYLLYRSWRATESVSTWLRGEETLLTPKIEPRFPCLPARIYSIW